MTEARTVGELIEQLQKLDPKLLVMTEGCDCTGPWSGTVAVYGKAVEIERNDRRDDKHDFWKAYER